MNKFNLTEQHRLIPFLDEKAIKKHFFINRCREDPQLIQHLQQQKTAFVEETVRSSPHFFMHLPFFNSKAKMTAWKGFDEGFGLNANKAILHGFHPAYRKTTERLLFKHMGTIGYCALFASATALGLIAGMIISSVTGIVTLLQGSLIGLGGGLMLGATTGHVLYNNIFNSYEQLFLTGAKEGGKIYRTEMEKNTQTLEQAITHAYEERHNDQLYQNNGLFTRHFQSPYNYPVIHGISYLGTELKQDSNNKKNDDEDVKVKWSNRVTNQTENATNSKTRTL